MLPDFSFENKYWARGYSVIGIDEVGRGCIAGPITVGAYVLDPLDVSQSNSLSVLGINDSKKLSEKRRESIYSFLIQHSDRCHHASVDVSYINDHGIMKAWRTAVGRIIQKIQKASPDKNFVLLVDGREVKEIPCTDTVEIESIIKGDTKSIAIAAASIIAKVTRDRYMKRLSEMHPEYFWEKNKGYGTQDHIKAVRELGITPWHRTLFVRSIIS